MARAHMCRLTMAQLPSLQYNAIFQYDHTTHTSYATCKLTQFVIIAVVTATATAAGDTAYTKYGCATERHG
jgi:hypothetical protein